MFPNVRLMIVAIMASILGMSCGLGVFAVFRVNHDPFVRLPSATPPLQLAFSNAAPITFTDPAAKDGTVRDLVVAPFGARFEVNLPQSIRPAPPFVPPANANAAAAPAQPPASEAASETSQAVAALEAKPETAPPLAVPPDGEAGGAETPQSVTAADAEPAAASPMPR